MSDKKVSYSSPPTDLLSPIFKYWTTSSGQYGLVNIRYGASSDAQTEQDIVENVAGYGKQIGRVLDAVVFLANHLGKKDNPILTNQAIKDLMDLNTEIQARKSIAIKEDGLTLTQFIDNLSTLKKNDQATFEEVSSKLKSTLDKLS